MMTQTIFKNVPQNFHKEIELLSFNGINSWDLVLEISDEKINQLIQGKLASFRNIKRLQCMAIFICELKLELDEAALLMQSGIGSVKFLSELSPEDLVKRTGRWERALGTGKDPILNLKKAFLWTKKAKEVRKK